MKPLPYLVVLVFLSSCLGWTEKNSTAGKCKAAEFNITNTTESNIIVKFSEFQHEVKPGTTMTTEVKAGTYKVCIAEVCESITLYPCLRYDFTRTLE